MRNVRTFCTTSALCIFQSFMRIALALVRVAQVEAFSKTGLDYDRCLIRSALTIILFNCCAPEFVVYQQFRRLYQISDSAAHSRCASLFPLESSGFQLDELLVIFESKHVTSTSTSTSTSPSTSD